MPKIKSSPDVAVKNSVLSKLSEIVPDSVGTLPVTKETDDPSPT